MNASPTETVRGRRRKTWACSECHRRKLQCDRSRPSCKRCSKAGRAACCYYTSPEEVSNSSRPQLETNTQPTDIGAALQPDEEHLSQVNSGSCNNNSSLEKRIQILETILSSRTFPYNSQQFAPDQTSYSIESRLPVKDYMAGNLISSHNSSKSNMFRGSSFRTQFRGATFSGSMAERIVGLNSFTKDAFEISTALEQIRQAGNQSQFSLGVLVGPESSGETLFYMLPSKEETDRLVTMYMDSIDHVYHVIHRPTFDIDYADLWIDGIGSGTQSVILVLLIVAIAYCSMKTDDNHPEPHSGVTRDRARNILDACDNWFQSRIAKFESRQEFQIHFLILLGRQLSAKRYKRTWVNAGKLIRAWMCCGLHRDPRAMGGDATPLDREIRKRMWAAAAEFELQASFEHGMCAHSWLPQSDIGPPSNIADTNLNDCSRAPPLHAYTPASYLALSGESLQFRHQLNTILNSVNHAMTFEEMKHYADKLLGYVQAIPEWNGKHPKVMHALLSLNLQQYLLALYEQQLSCTTSRIDKQFLQTALFGTAYQMVHCHSVALSTGSQVVEILSGDHLRTALSLCRSYMSDESLSDNMLISVEKYALHMLEELVDLACERVKHFGGDRRHFWLICAAAGLLQSTGDPVGRERYIQKAVNHFSKPYEYLLEDSATHLDVAATLGPNTLVYQPQDDLMNWALEDWSLGLSDVSH